MQRSVCIAEFRMILAVGAAMGQYFCYVRFALDDRGEAHLDGCSLSRHGGAPPGPVVVGTMSQRRSSPASRECMAMEPDPTTKFLKFILLLKIS